MDRRGVCLLALALGLGGGGAGCVQSRMTMGLDGKEVVAPGPPADPKKSCANLSVAYGRVHESKAAEPNAQPEVKRLFLDQARVVYLKALEAEPKNLDALLGMARVSAGLEDPDQAKQYLTRATQMYPKATTAWYEVGMFHCKRKEWTPALDALSKAHQLEPNNHEIAKTYGLALARAGQTERSVAVLSKEMGKAQAHYNVAGMLAHLNQPEQSKMHLRLALQYQQDHPAAQELLARLEGRPPANPQAQQGVVTVGFVEQPMPQIPTLMGQGQPGIVTIGLEQ
jgi:tetratricopeptide (TPR) repeat protein